MSSSKLKINKLNRYVEQALATFPNVDGILIVDTDAIVRYYYSLHENLTKMSNKKILGSHIFQIYPELNEENSYIIKSIKTGKSFINYEQTLIDINNNPLRSMCSTVPIMDGDKMVAVAEISTYMDKSVTEKSHRIEVNGTLQENDYHDTLDSIISESAAMESIKDQILKNSNIESPVLIYGKTGTGKELVVHAIHQCSNRRFAPFITQNCAAIPSSLLESILFGNTEGSFTGAKNSIGLFEMANHGTLFLDEINSMELEAQSKILRVLEEKCIRKIGDKKTTPIDVRVVAAVNEDPIECIEKGRLREDLYYRLNVIRYDIPPLKDRKDDIIPLMEHYRKQYNNKLSRNVMEFSEEVKNSFLQYDWPGNVRELKNIIEASMINNYGLTFEMENIPSYIAARMIPAEISLENNEPVNLSQIVADYEKKIITEKYIANNKKLSATAASLGLSKQALGYKLKKYGIG